MKPSGAITNPETFPATSPRRFWLRCWTSMFTTEGATRPTALTTAREYSSKSAASAAPAGVLLTNECSGFASPSKHYCRAACSKFVVVIRKNFKLTNPVVNYSPIQTIRAIWEVACHWQLDYKNAWLERLLLRRFWNRNAH